MATHAVFCSSQQPSLIIPAVKNDGAVITQWEHTTVLPDTSSASPRIDIVIMQMINLFGIYQFTH